MHHKIRIFFILTMLISSLFLVNAQEENFANIRVLLTVKSVDESVSIPLNSVISDSISLEFVLENFDILKEKPEELTLLLDQGRKSRSSYLVEALYSVVNSSLSIQLKCFRIADEKILYTSNIESRIGLDLDVTIRDAAKVLINMINRDIRENPQLVTFLIYEKESVSPEDDPSGYVLSLGFTPFIPIGSAAGYFDPGIGGDFQFLRKMDSSIGTFGAGWFLSVNIAKASGVYNSSDNLFLTSGPYASYLYNLNKLFSLEAHIYGGPALLMVNRNQEGYLNLIVPFISFGLGGQIHLRESFGMLIAMDINTYFERSLIISGILPKIGVYLNL